MKSVFGTFVRFTLPLAALNFLNQASRTVMAIIGPVLAVEFALSASELGLLAACMFAAYAAVQLPVGVALDMLGTRRVQSALALVTAAGFAAFAMADGLAGFSLARVVLGVGISAGLMAILKANTQWFPPAQVAGMTGIGMAVATLGSVLTTAPVEAALPSIGWRGVFWLLAGLALVVAVWIYASVRDKPRPAARRTIRDEVSVMREILGSRVFWRYAPAVSMLSILNFAYLGLWAGPWLRDVAGYDGPTRAQTLLCYTLAMTAGTFTSGQLSSRVQARGRSALLVPAVCFAGLLAAQIGLMLQPSGAAVTVLWVMFAFFGAGGPTGYVAVGQMFPPEQMGRVSTGINTLLLAGAFLLQAAIGWILDLWPRGAAGGWDARGYSAALLLSVVMQLAIAAFVLIPARLAGGTAARRG